MSNICYYEGKQSLNHQECCLECLHREENTNMTYDDLTQGANLWQT